MPAVVYDKIVKYKIEAICRGPLHVGSAIGGKEEVLVHPVDGFPFIQASSIAGIFRSYYKSYHSVSETETLFGLEKFQRNMNAHDYQSRAVFTDGSFEQSTVHMELRPHVKIDRKTGTVDSENGSGQKFDMEYIGIGAEFSFLAYLYLREKDQEAEKGFEEVLGALKAGELTFGGKKSSGNGQTGLIKALKASFDMTNSKDREKWMKEEELSNENYEDITQMLSEEVYSNKAYRVKVSGKTEGAVQVKGIAVSSFGKDAPKSENIRNAAKDFIVPGSSFRGTLRAQMEKICKYLKLDSQNLIEKSFGTGGEESATGSAGNLIIYDTVIGDQESIERIPLKHRIHIDKFTGGVFNQGLFSEKNAAGDVVFTIDILKKNLLKEKSGNDAEKTLGILMMALRDLAIGMMSVGNGFNVGKGIITVKYIEIEIPGTEKYLRISFDEQMQVTMTGNTEIIEQAFQALRGGK